MGGYFDVDVEIIKNMDDIFKKGAFMGEQIPGRVAPGLCMGAEPGMKFYKDIIDMYDSIDFELSKDSNKQVTIVQHTTDLLKRYGYIPGFRGIQSVAGINIYPPDYFNPQDFQTGIITTTGNTCTIHHFAESWKCPIERKLHQFDITMNRYFGVVGKITAYIIGLPYYIFKKLQTKWIRSIIQTVKHKLKGNMIKSKTDI